MADASAPASEQMWTLRRADMEMAAHGVPPDTSLLEHQRSELEPEDGGMKDGQHRSGQAEPDLIAAPAPPYTNAAELSKQHVIDLAIVSDGTWLKDADLEAEFASKA